MAESKDKEVVSRPYPIENAKDSKGGTSIFYAAAFGKLSGKDFLPPENLSRASVGLYQRISESRYNTLKNANPKLVDILEGDVKVQLVASSDKNGILQPTEIASEYIRRNLESFTPNAVDAVTEAIKEVDWNDKSNIKPNTAKTSEGNGDSSVKATPIIGTQNLPRKFRPILVYPSDMKDQQDRIQFEVYKHATRDISESDANIIAGNLITQITPGKEDSNYVRVENTETVFLPITKVSDSNTVDWNDDAMNTLQRSLAEISVGLMTGDNENALEQSKQLLNTVNTSEFKNMGLLYLAGQAVGVGGLLTRATGAIFNPNLELLFRGPQLRSFAFNFAMIPRNQDDAVRIKQIIKFFKSNMAVRLGDENTKNYKLFLQSPYVFKIKYISGVNINDKDKLTSATEHNSLNKMKLCALQACNVDYTPMGSYMTFNDADKTMFMYNLGLQFKEIHPIYNVNYQDDGNHGIGY